jgi:hypothetical protein
VTSNPPAVIQSLIDAHINAFNTQDKDLFLSVFGDTAIIIDGIAPYRWLNPNAPANWLADVKKWREDLGVTYEHLSHEMGFWNAEGSSGYAERAGEKSKARRRVISPNRQTQKAARKIARPLNFTI